MEGDSVLKIVSFIGTALVGCGMIGLAVIGSQGGHGILKAGAFQSGAARLPNPAAGGAMLVSGAIILFSGKNRVS